MKKICDMLVIMTDNPETFFTAVGCMDGRVQEPVAQFGRGQFGAFYPDTITEAGLVGLLAKDTPDESLLFSIKKKIGISIEKHRSQGIIVHGHAECAGNPVPDDVHKDNIRKAVLVIIKMIPQNIPVMGVFVKREGKKWVCEEVPHTVIV